MPLTSGDKSEGILNHAYFARHHLHGTLIAISHLLLLEHSEKYTGAWNELRYTLSDLETIYEIENIYKW